MIGRREAPRGRSGRGLARFVALAAIVFAGCGGGPKLTNLRCRQVPCQDPEDPFKLRLAVDFEDDSGTLSQGSLELLVNGNLQQAVSLSDLFTAQGLGVEQMRGTLQVNEDLSLSTVTDGEAFSVGLQARDGSGQQTNAPALSLTLSLGGGN